ncbi:MAG: aconitate hydratase, partial [Actinomycetia bacterium]|nr:aconitate hydratase [Actinomycetes bacterium]
TMLGSDSHTPTAGGIGMIGIGVGGLDVALALSGREFYLTAPGIIKVTLKNSRRDWVTAKDIILHILSILSTKGNVGKVLEYTGDISGLSVPERSTITNMGAETGVTTSIFASDKETEKFLTAQGRGENYRELLPDKNAEYEREIVIDLAELKPLVACPHSPGNIKSVEELEGIKVDQICIGSCTNSSYTDLMSVAQILKNKKIDKNISLIISPGSKQVMNMLAENGALADFISAGARIGESVCGFCIGNGYSPNTNGISLRTINRNFYGRSGTLSANVYLVSPETAAIAALTGELTSPEKSGIEFKRYSIPEKYNVDDSMIIKPLPDKEREKIEISRGPNIGDPPGNKPFPNIIDGIVTI